jgi:ABC-type protease/lipase transport system fused ATPase/permease subunit
MFRFVLALGALMLILAGALHGLEVYELSVSPSRWLETLLLMGVITAAVYVNLTKPAFSAARDFSLFYLASIALKLVGGCGYLIAVMIFDPSGATSNAVFFLICYLLFTGLEVAFLWARLQSQNGVKKG